jgi:hypothetical protein
MRSAPFLAVAALAPAISAQANLYQQCPLHRRWLKSFCSHHDRWWHWILWKHKLCLGWILLQGQRLYVQPITVSDWIVTLTSCRLLAVLARCWFSSSGFIGRRYDTDCSRSNYVQDEQDRRRLDCGQLSDCDSLARRLFEPSQGQELLRQPVLCIRGHKLSSSVARRCWINCSGRQSDECCQGWNLLLAVSDRIVLCRR